MNTETINPLVKAFEVYRSEGFVKEPIPPCLNIEEVVNGADLTSTYGYEYVGKVQLARKGYVFDARELVLFKERALREFNHAIYGPFYELLLRADRALYERDFQKVRDIITQLLAEMRP